MTFDDKDLPRLVTKKWIEVYDQSEKNYHVNKEIRIKNLMPRSDLCDLCDFIVVKRYVTVTEPEETKFKKKTKVLHLKITHHLSTAFRKSMLYKLTMQKIWML